LYGEARRSKISRERRKEERKITSFLKVVALLVSYKQWLKILAAESTSGRVNVALTAAMVLIAVVFPAGGSAWAQAMAERKVYRLFRP
jgi:small-conductance mechanosensitive channel